MKVALVTGASKGIGKACALRLARDGYTVVVNYSSSDEAANATLDQIKAEGGDGMIYKANVADLSQVKVMVREVFKAYGRIDVLVNNAGIVRRIPDDDESRNLGQVLRPEREGLLLLRTAGSREDVQAEVRRDH